MLCPLLVITQRMQISVPFDPQIHHRRSIRLDTYNYAQDGAYFVTICTRNRACVFGDVVSGDDFDRVELSVAGRIVEACWREIPDHYPHVVLDGWVIMPNHLHGILFLHHEQERAQHAVPLPETGESLRGFGRAVSGDLTMIMKAFKAAATRQMRAFFPQSGSLWQRGYYEHVIRNARELDAIREYILMNPARWLADEYYKGL